MHPVSARHGERGYAMIAVIGVTAIVAVIGSVLVTTITGNLGFARHSREEKAAYAAAQSGVAYYVQQLARNNDGAALCEGIADPDDGPPPINQPWNGVGEDPRVWRALPIDDQAVRAAYTVELLGVGNRGCRRGDITSVVDARNGTINLRVTGRTIKAGRVEQRTLVTSLRRASFLDFVYFTNFETTDPLMEQQRLSGYVTDPGIASWWSGSMAEGKASPTPSELGCAQFRDPDRATDRDDARFPGLVRDGAGRMRPAQSVGFNLPCTTIQFMANDQINGPFHTNDSIFVCGRPSFGRPDTDDRVEYRAAVGCDASAAPNVRSSRLVTGTQLKVLPMPKSNAAVAETAAAPYRFKGLTDITLSGRTMTVNGVPMAVPANGVVSVGADPSRPCPAYDPKYPEASRGGCGIARVRGSYGANLTITASQDIVVVDDVTRTSDSDALLGLLATDYVRVAHPVAAYPCTANTRNTGQTGNRRIEAAIMALQHVFQVDAYECGGRLATLEVTGAIVQNWRGTVGTGAPTGYTKDYRYDDRLSYRSPPFFVQPTQSAWQPVRTIEQSGEGTKLD